MHCAYHVAEKCFSCTHIDVPYNTQLTRKWDQIRELLAPHTDPTTQLLSPVRSEVSHFRNKAKMAVGGTVTQPTLGLLDRYDTGTDLRACPLYPREMAHLMESVAEFITAADLTPYDLHTRRGELKFVLATITPDNEFLVRFVMRSTESLARIRKHLPSLLEHEPGIVVASVNILAEHKAVTEGDHEIPLTDQQSLRMRLGDKTLLLRPQSFFQTNTDIAIELYRSVARLTADGDMRIIWDLYCGVGGFAIHCAAEDRRVIGVEVSEQAIEAARESADLSGVGGITFLSDDATAWAASALADPDSVGGQPDAIIVNPPRRGIGEELATLLGEAGSPTLIYSSCNPKSLAADLALLTNYRLVSVQMFDMFPHTSHTETLVHLTRR